MSNLCIMPSLYSLMAGTTCICFCSAVAFEIIILQSTIYVYILLWPLSRVLYVVSLWLCGGWLETV